MVDVSQHPVFGGSIGNSFFMSLGTWFFFYIKKIVDLKRVSLSFRKTKMLESGSLAFTSMYSTLLDFFFLLFFFSFPAWAEPRAKRSGQPSSVSIDTVAAPQGAAHSSRVCS